MADHVQRVFRSYGQGASPESLSLNKHIYENTQNLSVIQLYLCIHVYIYV